MELSALGAMVTARSRLRPETVQWASAAMRNVELDIASARTLDCNVLISGESGVGKKTIACRLYRQSRRASKPLVIFSAADVLNSMELLNIALLEARPDGTILLEEPHRTSPSVQSRLLQFVERRIGHSGAREIAGEGHDVRLLTVTSRDLFELVQRDQFIESLFYRLNPIHLIIPPLRTRPEDIAVLLEYFFPLDAGVLPALSADAWQQVIRHTWPGNVRELREVATALASRNLHRTIESADLPTYLAGCGGSSNGK
jgi:two-component system response regulator AtoC